MYGVDDVWALWHNANSIVYRYQYSGFLSVDLPYAILDSL